MSAVRKQRSEKLLDPEGGPEGTREMILHGALGVFLDHGYDQVSMDSIAVKSGVARRTLYNQFPEGKEAVFRSATELFWTGFPVFQWSAERGVRQELTQAATDIAQFWRQERAVAYLRLAIAETKRFPNLMGFIGAKGMLPMMQQIMRYLEIQTKRKVLRVPSAELAMRQFFGLVCEPLLWPYVVGLQAKRSPAYEKEVIDSAIAMFLRMYAPA